VDIEPGRLVLGIVAAAAILSVAAGISVKAGLFSLPRGKGQRTTPAEITLVKTDRDAPVQTGGSYRYVLTANQVLSEYSDAQKLFASYRDEAARVKLNHILESNASEPVKNKARLLASYMETPGFNTLKDRFSYADVTKDPFLYRDCYVIWRGMASNLKVEQTHTSFDFLVGYDTRRTMEGIVHVDYDFAIAVNPELPVEILGRIIPLSIDREPKIRIQGAALNQVGLLDKKGSREQ
ncbi:MAG: tetratricopeptide repeat protein, partial [Treponema sp.]|nr:tetratricopeptide repeat protein [Treponema sp.]